LFSGDKRVIYPVFYYLLTRLSDLEKRAYLSKFLVPFTISEDVPIDDEIKKYMDEYRDLQAEF
jgi:intraflagellar transport protein 81